MDVRVGQSWALKNWCFWTVVLEKTLESPLECKEIQPVNPEGDQSWIFIGKTVPLTVWNFVGKGMSLIFNMLSRLVITFPPRSKCLLISWLQSPSAVILEPPKIKSVMVSTVFPSICYEVMGPVAMILVFWMLSFKPTFSLSFFTFIKRLFCSSLSARGVGHLHIWGYWYFSRQSWFLHVLSPAQSFSWCTLHIS